MQTLPWGKPMATWEKNFLEAKSRSPQPTRSAKEWNLFRKSELAAWLTKPGRLVQVEVPFLWREAGSHCLEGVMDLAVFTEAESTWQVIDWKTNRVGASAGAGLVELYRRQIQAYVRALREMLHAEVRGSLYLTQTGEWLPVD
jgi:ATP-dependent exoDNAse (exonuclease V) beta subunit